MIMIDRYTKIVLTIIACALLYICAAITPLPSVAAQVVQSSKRPAEATGPAEVVIVGWKQTAPMEVAAQEPLRVITERSSDAADRVVLVGFEAESTAERPTPRSFRALPRAAGIPVSQQ
jgi:hypothetical protein